MGASEDVIPKVGEKDDLRVNLFCSKKDGEKKKKKEKKSASFKRCHSDR